MPTETTAPPARGTLAWWEDTVNTLEDHWISLATMHVDERPTTGQMQRIESLLAAIHAASAPPLILDDDAPPIQQGKSISYADGLVDDVAITGNLLRMEQMDRDAWWVCIYRGERRTAFCLRWDKKTKNIIANVTDDNIPTDDGETTDGKEVRDGRT